MCGIVGYVGNKENSVRVLIDGLKKLEYRGYDSAGIAFISNGKLNIQKEKGELVNLQNRVNLDKKLDIGIGHTRWATHGKSNALNAHPHRVGKFTIVHNGIIENYNELKEELKKEGYDFNSETDTEVLCSLIDKLYKEDNNILNVINKLKNEIKGTYAVGIMCDDYPD